SGPSGSSSSSSVGARGVSFATWSTCSLVIAIGVDPSKKNGPLSGPVTFGSERKLRSGLHVRGLGALRPLDHLELHALAFGQRLVALHRDRREVDEHVVATLTLDEAVALLVRKPLHGALTQNSSSQQATARAPSRRPMITT